MATKQETGKQQDFDVNQAIDELMQTLQGDLSEIDIDSALSLIDQWHGFLSKTKEPDLKELASELKELQKLIKSGKATGHDISGMLIHLGESTAEVSDVAEKGSKQPVQRLGKQLRKAGTSIAKAEDQEYHEQLDALMEKAEEDELTSLDTEEAIGVIDTWYNLLSKAEGEQFHAVADSLKHLKQVLKRGNAKPETIAKALSQVGEQTTELSSEVPRGFKGIIKKLGRQLNQASESLADAE
jgi:predicted RND superfamily exporter protein